MEKNLVELVQRNAIENPQKTAFKILNKTEITTVCYSDFYTEVRTVAAALKNAGVQPHDRIVLCSENRYEWFVSLEAIFLIGAIAVPLYATASAEQQQFITKDCTPVFGFFSKKSHYDKIANIAKATFINSVLFDENDASADSAVSLTDFMEQVQPLPDDTTAPTGDNDTAVLIYTSGTTGEPKGVMLSHHNILSNVTMLEPIVAHIPQFDYLSLLPLSHAYEFTVLQVVFKRRGSIAPVKTMAKAVDYIRILRPNVACAVPRLFEKIYNSVVKNVQNSAPIIETLFQDGLSIGEQYYSYIEQHKPIPRLIPRIKFALYKTLVFNKIRKETIDSIELFISGGAALQPEIGRFFNILGTTILEGYGITECSPVVSCNLPNDREVGTVGPPLPGVEIRLSDEQELLVRGALVMKGYYKHPQETAAVIDTDGWFHTGDLAEITETGKIKIIGRSKELIVLSNGKNVVPTKMENRLSASPFIDQICVVGDGQKYVGALIVPDLTELQSFAKSQHISVETLEELVSHPRITAQIKTIVSEANKTFEKQEMIKEFKLLTEPFTVEKGEITPTMKIRRKVIADHYRDTITSLFPTTR